MTALTTALEPWRWYSTTSSPVEELGERKYNVRHSSSREEDDEGDEVEEEEDEEEEGEEEEEGGEGMCCSFVDVGS